MLCFYRHVMKAKALEDVVGIGHLALIGTDSFGICGLTVCLMANPIRAMTSVTFNPAAKLMFTGQGAGTTFYFRAGCSPPFLLPLPSRFPPLLIPSV